MNDLQNIQQAYLESGDELDLAAYRDAHLDAGATAEAAEAAGTGLKLRRKLGRQLVRQGSWK